jgi:hypothetical protein
MIWSGYHIWKGFIETIRYELNMRKRNIMHTYPSKSPDKYTHLGLVAASIKLKPKPDPIRPPPIQSGKRRKMITRPHI